MIWVLCYLQTTCSRGHRSIDSNLTSGTINGGRSANVGRNLIISKGEIVALDARTDTITIAEIEMPAPCSKQAARTLEKQFLSERPTLMAERRALDLRKSKEYVKTHPHQGRLATRKKTTLVNDHSRGTHRNLHHPKGLHETRHAASPSTP